MVKELTREILWEVGAQFGHYAKRWNPKMKPYIYGQKNKIHIIDLQKTITSLDNLKTLMDSIAENKGKILFVGTKKSAKSGIKEAAERTQNFYVNHRWLGGTLTNLKTIHLSIKKLWDIERKEKSGYYDKLTKKEVSLINKQKEKLENLLSGIKHMRSLPSALVVVDPKQEIIAVKEARKLNIPIIGICDTNSDPDLVDYVIPGNDDIFKSVTFLLNHIAEIYAESFKMEIPPTKPIERWKPRTDTYPRSNYSRNDSYPRNNNYPRNDNYKTDTYPRNNNFKTDSYPRNNNFKIDTSSMTDNEEINKNSTVIQENDTTTQSNDTNNVINNETSNTTNDKNNKE